MNKKWIVMSLLFLAVTGNGFENSASKRPRAREFGCRFGILPTGKYNAISDVEGVLVGHVTLIESHHIRTGVTAILPHGGNVFQEKVPAAVYVGNGFGKLTGISQVEELGNIETPIVLTNTLSVPVAAEALVDYTLSLPDNGQVGSVNPVVGETNDGHLNDIRARFVNKTHVLKAIASAHSGPVAEGTVGAGTGTVCFGFKGGIGTASRILPAKLGGYTVGVLVQSNFGGVLRVDGLPVGRLLKHHYLYEEVARNADGSCMIVVATDAPLSARNLKRLARRAIMGLALTGGIGSNGSGDYVIAFSTAADCRILHTGGERKAHAGLLRNEALSPLFLAVIEATEEAIINSMFKATPVAGADGRSADVLPLDRIRRMLNIREKMEAAWQ